MPNPNKTEVMIILDRSGSMHSMWDFVIEGYNEFIYKQKQLPGECTVSLILFDDQYEEIYLSKNIQEIDKLTKGIYSPRGMTALNDAISKSILNLGQKFSNMEEGDRPSKVVVCIITDGQENNSFELPGAEGSKKIKEMIKHQEEVYSWEFVLMGTTDISIENMACDYGIASTHSYTYVRGASGALGPQGSIGTAFHNVVTAYRSGTSDNAAFTSSGTEN